MSDDTSIKQALVPVGDTIYAADVIEHEGKLWIVPHWLDSPTEGWSTPTRIIRMDKLPHQATPNRPEAFVVNVPIPKEFVGLEPIPALAKIGFEIVETPDVKRWRRN